MAEWLGLLCASRIVSDNNLNNIIYFLDSEMIVDQMNGINKTKIEE